MKKVYPTMITPYTEDGRIDFDGVRRIVDWYAERGCHGIFAVCQSSEMQFLSLRERVALSRAVAAASAGRMHVVASGHCAESIDEQAEEVNAMAETGVEAVVLVTNRLDLHNDGDDVWIRNAERLLAMIRPDIPLGIYECPNPYKRLLSEKLLRWCISTGRFRFIKDTCCDYETILERLKLLEGSGIELYNANAQTLLPTMQCGAAGYSGVMANFHPELYVYLCENYEKEPEKAKLLASFLELYAFTECMDYPVTAKYHMNLEGVPMGLFTRSRDPKELTAYQKMAVERGRTLENYFREQIGWRA